jgi:uncharacterized membrane protein
MAALLALLSAVAYGVGDFFGGLSARRLPSSAVVLRTHVAGLAGLVVVLPLVEASPGGHDILVGAVGGVAGGLGVLLFYRAMAEGTMSLVAPITSVLTAMIPVVYGLATGERPSLLGFVGIPIALVAVTLLARDPGESTRSGLSPLQALQALAAGLGFGMFFIALDMAGDGAGLWPVVAGRTTSVTLFALVALVNPAARVGRAGARTGPLVAMLVACGLLDAWANALLLFATHHGMITLVAVLGSLYPAATLLLARTVLGERLARPQLGGVALAGAAVVLVSVG